MIIKPLKESQPKETVYVFLTGKDGTCTKINVRVDGEDFQIAWISQSGTMNRMTLRRDDQKTLEAAGFKFDGGKIQVEK
jgi:hypothetical protein